MDKVLRFFEILGVKYLNSHQGSIFADGLFNTIEDYIFVKPNLENNRAIEVFLHELVHWTGHDSRLARSAIVLNQRLSKRGVIYANEIDFYNREMSTEEMIAQYGMYLLTVKLGLDEQYFYNRFTQYTNGLVFGDIELAKRQAQIAVDYILNQCSAALKEVA
jgi:antirestriction protein ArdC